ncbi:sugar transferase [Croceivirga thetidis]|uniref:Exopolysaccharide biosynthesis protein n=1 Tax=Croceivirga thetidis TaxID=2721623 RepID=A0ABX1GQ77_9FLAO|nr:sugar transferase [Croceivirga thetidis]NKI31191.1 exopolysaccharide biosynthesis protein [Croceivirga thetidis]
MKRPSVLNSIERKFILLIGDLLIVSASLNVLVNHAIDDEFTYTRLKLILFCLGFATYFFISYILDFYNLEKAAKRRIAVSQAFYIGSLIVFSIFIECVLVFDISFWRKPLLYFLFLTPSQLVLWRFLFSNIFRIVPVIKNVLYVYDDINSANLKEDTDAINGLDTSTFYKVKLTHRIGQMTPINKSYFASATEKIDTTIINIKNYDSLPKELENMVLESIIKGKEVISFTSFYENVYEAIPVKSQNESFFEILQLRNRKIRYLQRLFTVFINFFFSLFVGVIFMIFCPFVWLLNFLFNRGPLFYTQKRIGKHGKEFSIYKFRSMVVDAEKGGAAMAKKGDARVTPFGKILRMFRIDELPQVLSIIKGDMQFIGPRPERKVFVDKLNEITPFYNTRHLIKPGITGWAQVKYKYGQNLEDSIRKLEYDLYYIKNKSITLDLRIIFKTVTTVLFSRGV